ncbi:hypothetical protein BN946_scf184985.g104 [Trametes cinnabarina]|uniref:DNA2/NAM7 helicase-like C-terminal domain-containing protein n=1 Tax=Pycnoporus cinnabarinus TaxID=5643 RepID=A0A060SKB5_PYCCI|nr:hypothetical protein BN946_scf184985.g104 [Trametes cinnabarina]
MPVVDPQRLQRVIPGFAESDVPYRRLTLNQCNCNRLEALLGLGKGPDAQAVPVGAALRLSEKGAISSVVLATEALGVVQINAEIPKSQSGAPPVRSLTKGLAGVLANPHCVLVGVGMPRIVLLLRHQLEVDCAGVDLPTIFSDLAEKGLPSPGDVVQEVLSARADQFKVNALWHHQTNDDLCLRAWLSACVGTRAYKRLAMSAKLRTRYLPAAHLQCLAVTAMNIELLEVKKPTHMENEFSDVQTRQDGSLVLHNARFQNRVRKSQQTRVEINGGAMIARPFRAVGRKTQLQFLKGSRVPVGDIKTVRVLGREEPTSSELARNEFFSNLLHGTTVLDNSDFIRLVWFSSGKRVKAKKAAQNEQFSSLNRSQRVVATAMIENKEPLVIVHGPPGTGKTTTIAAALDYWQVYLQPVWVIAQSNVGVKNIARSIIKRDIKFKLIVSKEFHFEWHEHLYAGPVEDTLIRSEEFFNRDFDPVHRIGDVQIVLCTLAMLSNPMLSLTGMFKHRPMQHLVVDEASQIDTSEFMHLFDRFEDLRKVCMFGDPKQLPPFGKEHASKMKTIFDFPHLKDRAYFLDTQYRMPVPLGDFISGAVYKSKLASVHDITGRECIRAIDVRKGKEDSVDTSWRNVEEARTVVNLVKHYYQKLDFCIITPYDAQRATIRDLLKAANLTAASDKVYNVDSYQGHEAPYVIVSAVRTTTPRFLSLDNRVNVMLTRCQRGMILVTQRTFAHGGGKNTLLGKLVKQWEDADDPAEGLWVDAMEVADRRANLPGAPGKFGRR